MPRRVTKFNHRDISGRQLFLISVDDLTEIFPLPERDNSNFAVLLAIDGRKELVGNLGNIPQRLVAEGLVYLCAWGEDCKRVHDIFDDAAFEMESKSKKEMTVMTTWHDKENIEEALWALLFCAIPEEQFIDTCKTSYVISVSNSEWTRQLENGLSDIEGLDSRVAV